MHDHTYSTILSILRAVNESRTRNPETATKIIETAKSIEDLIQKLEEVTAEEKTPAALEGIEVDGGMLRIPRLGGNAAVVRIENIIAAENVDGNIGIFLSSGKNFYFSKGPVPRTPTVSSETYDALISFFSL